MSDYDRSDDSDVGIFMKQESVMSLYEPTTMSPTNNKVFLLPTMPDMSRNGATSNGKSEIKRNASYGNLPNQAEARVLVLYTGGTIGMLRNDKNGKWHKNLLNNF